MPDFSIQCAPVADAPIVASKKEKPQTTVGIKDIMPLEKLTFAPPPEQPTQESVEGIRFDFNDGLRVRFPESGEYRCVFTDLDTGCLLYSMDVAPGCTVASVKKFYIRFGLEIYRKDQLKEPIFRHELNLAGKEVMIQLPVGALGDTVAWFSYVERFQRQHGCKLTVSMASYMADLFRDQYPEIRFVSKDEAVKLAPYATYNLGLFFGGDVNHQPFDFRQVGLHRTAGHILGVADLSDIPPRVNLSAPRRITEPYVVIASQASSQCKYWNNPSGWREVVGELKKRGYRVLCIDRMPEYGMDYIWNHIPYGCEDFTGDKPLQERIDIIKDAAMFIGLTSGLSWIAWCCRVPVILISGFTDPVNEFATPYRVQNFTVCHGCWNDMRCEFKHKEFLWCPRAKSDSGKFECTKAITAKMVIDKIGMAEKNLEKNRTSCPEK